MSDNRIKLQDEISAQFAKGDVLTASDEKLQEYLMSLSSGHVPNDMVRHREIIRGMTINHIQMKRHIDGLNRQNSFTQKCVIALTVMSLLGTAVQAIIAVRTEIKVTSSTTATTPQEQTTEHKTATPKSETGVSTSSKHQTESKSGSSNNNPSSTSQKGEL